LTVAARQRLVVERDLAGANWLGRGTAATSGRASRAASTSRDWLLVGDGRLREVGQGRERGYTGYVRTAGTDGLSHGRAPRETGILPAGGRSRSLRPVRHGRGKSLQPVFLHRPRVSVRRQTPVHSGRRLHGGLDA
jgi:hypothetical protein